MSCKIKMAAIDTELIRALVAQLSNKIDVNGVYVVYNEYCINWQLMPFPAAILKCIDPDYTLEMHNADYYPRGRDHPALYKMMKITEMLGIDCVAQNANGESVPLEMERLSPESVGHFKIIIEAIDNGKFGEGIQVDYSQIKLNKIGAMIDKLIAQEAPDDAADLYDFIDQIKKITLDPMRSI